jgi:putative nucleotidyltransferase with HDIG domain
MTAHRFGGLKTKEQTDDNFQNAMNKSAPTISAGLRKVPPFPPVAAKLLSLLAKPDVDTTEVARLISTDPTFTARLLQRVNSVEFGLAAPVTNVSQSIALLGLDLTRQVTLTQATATYAAGALKTEELRRCWQHTVATAVLAEEIAKACGAFDKVAFTAGILHDIGRLGLLVAYPDEYERVMRNAAAQCLDILDFEREEFGMDHAEAGRMLAEGWGLPSELAMIAGRHHDPSEGLELDLLRIVHVACRLADALGYDVVKPLAPLDIASVLAELPDGGSVILKKTPAELCARVEEAISQYGSGQQDSPPEESLALLAAVAPSSADLPTIIQLAETNSHSSSQEMPAPEGRRRASIRALVILVLVVLAAVTFLVFSRMR